MTNEMLEKIFEKIREKSKTYPVTIKELAEELQISNGSLDRYIKILLKQGLIEGKRVTTPKGGVTYYKTPEGEWPEHLGRKCSECQFKAKNKTCTYHNELTERGVILRPERVKVTLRKNTGACDDFVERNMRLYSRKLERFLDENRRITVTEEGLKISYHCANEECKAELITLGEDFIATIGSSVIRCGECNAYYKTLFDKKKQEFRVHYNIEKGREYRKNFTKATKGEEPEKLYESDRYGIVIQNLEDTNFNFRTKTLAVNNWIGNLKRIKYLVVKREQDYELIKELLERKKYGDIDIISGAEKLVSPPPMKQHIGVLRLLREIKIMNKEFCYAMLISRITVIEKINEQFGRTKETVARIAIKKIEEIIAKMEGEKWLTAGEWNNLEMRAGNAMWGVVKEYLKTMGIDFPGRGNNRLVEDISVPHRRFYAYSPIDTLINGVFGLAGEFVKEYLMEIEFCWDGLPGLCHKNTQGGVFGLHLDMREPEKILTLPYLIEGLQNGLINIENIQYYRGRNRQKIFYIKKGTEIEEQLREIVETMKRGKINEKKAKEEIKNYYRQGKQWISNLYRRSNYHGIEHHGEEYLPWAIIQENVWQVLGREEQGELIKKLRKEHKEIGFKPLTAWEIN